MVIPEIPLAHIYFFGIYFGPNLNEAYATDPYGWDPTTPDPLINWPSDGQGNRAYCLWRRYIQDPISCNDLILEDGSWDFGKNGNWSEYHTGNGYQLYSRYNCSDDNQNVWWWHYPLKPGIYTIYVFIPLVSDATNEATYFIYTANNLWVPSPPIAQSNGTNSWVNIGIHSLKEESMVMLYAVTNEPDNTKVVFADAIKFRTFNIFLPKLSKQN